MSPAQSSTRSVSSSAEDHSRAFRALLDPTDLMPGHTVSDAYALRHLIRQSSGLPNSPAWLRPQAWLVLLGLLPTEKKEWRRALTKRRREYYQFVADLLPMSSPSPATSGTLSERDALLNQIYQDVSRSRKNAMAFYQADVPPSSSCPLAPEPPSEGGTALPDPTSSIDGNERVFKRRRLAERLPCRHDPLRRLATINSDFACGVGMFPNEEPVQHQSNTANRSKDLPPSPIELQSLSEQSEEGLTSPSITLSSPVPSSTESLEGATITGSSLSPLPPSNSDREPRRGQAKPVSASDIQFTDVRWHSLIRILYIYALLNPSTGYVQGQNEVAFVLLHVMGQGSEGGASSFTSTSPLSTPIAEERPPESPAGNGADASDDDDAAGVYNFAEHAEADAFWCFSALVGEVRELYEFDSLDHSLAKLHVVNARPKTAAVGGGNAGDLGMAGALKRMSRCLKWLDRELWAALLDNTLDPRLPYYSFRWLACLLSTELPFSSVVRVWDVILSEQSSSTDTSGDRAGYSAKIDVLIDLCCAMLIHIRIPLLMAMVPGSIEGRHDDDPDGDGFSRAMSILQNYPDIDLRPVIELTYIFRQRRLAASLTGDGPSAADSEDEDVSLASAVRERAERATKAIREWNRTTSPDSWFRGRSPSSPASQAVSTEPSPSTAAASSSVFQRYAVAFQSSDAAASLSKASTNWTARAIASWGGSNNSGSVTGKGTSPSSAAPVANGFLSAQTRMPSFTSAMGTVSSSFSKMRRTASETATSSASHHPASFRWSRDISPDLPLPDMLDSPAGRQEYAQRARPASIISPRRFFADGVNGSSSPRPSDFSSTPFGRDSTASLPHHSSALGGSRGSVSSPRPVAARGYSSPRESISSASGSVRCSGGGGGPKPLLLTSSARPPREGSSMGGLNLVEEPSRKVSSGPLGAAAASSEARASAYARAARRGSVAGSTHSASNSASQDASESSSTTSARISASLLSNPGTTHILPSMILATSLTSAAHSLSEKTVGGQLGQQDVSSQGTVPGKIFKTMQGAATSSERIAAALAIGAAMEQRETSNAANHIFASNDVPSDSDTPLVATGTVKSRTRDAVRRKASERSNVDAENSVTERASRGENNMLARRGSRDRSVSSADTASASPRNSVSSAKANSKRTSAFESPRPAPIPPSASSTVNGVTKYTLSDSPLHCSLDREDEEGDQVVHHTGLIRNERMTSNTTLSRSRGLSGSERGNGNGNGVSLSRSKGVKGPKERPGSGSSAGGGSFSESRRGSRRGSEGVPIAALAITPARNSSGPDSVPMPIDETFEGAVDHLGIPPTVPSPGLPSPGAQDGELVDLDALLERLDRSANASDFEGTAGAASLTELGELTPSDFVQKKGKGRSWEGGHEEEAMESIGRLTVTETDQGGLSGSDVE